MPAPAFPIGTRRQQSAEVDYHDVGARTRLHRLMQIKNPASFRIAGFFIPGRVHAIRLRAEPRQQSSPR
jgi:hypothetical protein